MSTSHLLRPPRLLLNAMLAGVVLRLANLAAWPLWLDEGATWVAATKPTWGGTLTAEANHPPLWWLLTRAWRLAFGDSELALRAPAALLGVLSVWLTWCVLLRALDPDAMPRRGGFDQTADHGRGRRIAAWTTALVAVLAYFLEYSQEARMYPLLLTLALGLTLVYLRWLDRPSGRVLALYAALGVLALYTHYFGALVLLTHGLHALWLARTSRLDVDRVEPRPLWGAIALAGLLFLPWFAYLLTHYGGMARARPEPFSTLLYTLWRVGVGPGILATSPERAAAGALATIRSAWPLVLGTILLWIVPVASGVLALRRRPGLRSLATFTLLVPPVFLLLVYPFFALIHERYLLFVGPWVVLLAVLGAFSLSRPLRAASLTGLVLLAAAGVVAYHGASPFLVGTDRAGTLEGEEVPARFVPDPASFVTRLTDGRPYGREPWRQVHEFVRAHARPNDLVAIHAWYMDYVWRYYAVHDPDQRPPLDTLLLPEHELGPDETRSRFADRLRDRRRVFLVLSHEETADPDHWRKALAGALLRQWVAEGARGFSRLDPVQFPHGVRVEIFVRR